MTAAAHQVELVEQLVAVAAAVKVTRDAHRQTVLVKELQRVGERFVSDFRLPLSPAMLVRGLDIEVRGSQCGNAWGGKGKRERGVGLKELDCTCIYNKTSGTVVNFTVCDVYFFALFPSLVCSAQRT